MADVSQRRLELCPTGTDGGDGTGNQMVWAATCGRGEEGDFERG
jgi:hypothetical protein